MMHLEIHFNNIFKEHFWSIFLKDASGIQQYILLTLSNDHTTSDFQQ